jgi:hypothetical protein
MIQIEGLFRRPESGREIEWEPIKISPKKKSAKSQNHNQGFPHELAKVT